MGGLAVPPQRQMTPASGELFPALLAGGNGLLLLRGYLV
jgi:hypothetical protein